MIKVIKAGCILLNRKNNTVAIVYREKYHDYSFPKGHLEEGESIEECALRETAEETKREARFLEKNPIFISKYTTPKNEDVSLFYFIAEDIGPSDNTSSDSHPTFWVPIDKVEDKLTYERVKVSWRAVKAKVKEYCIKKVWNHWT